MTFVDGTVVNVAMPVLRERLGADLAQAQWIVESYMLFLSSLMLAGGALGDRWAARRLRRRHRALRRSPRCGAAPRRACDQLITARGVQGMGAALLVPGSLSLISANFSAGSRGRAIGTWAAFTSMAAGIGPVIGGWLVEQCRGAGSSSSTCRRQSAFSPILRHCAREPRHGGQGSHRLGRRRPCDRRSLRARLRPHRRRKPRVRRVRRPRRTGARRARAGRLRRRRDARPRPDDAARPLSLAHLRRRQPAHAVPL